MKRIVLGALALSQLAGGASAQSPYPLRPENLSVGSGVKTATAVAGAVTLNKTSGYIVSESLTTAAGATYTLTITNSAIVAVDTAFASVQMRGSTTGLPHIATVSTSAGALTIVVRNAHASAALNGTISVSFLVIKN